MAVTLARVAAIAVVRAARVIPLSENAGLPPPMCCSALRNKYLVAKLLRFRKFRGKTRRRGDSARVTSGEADAAT